MSEVTDSPMYMTSSPGHLYYMRRKCQQLGVYGGIQKGGKPLTSSYAPSTTFKAEIVMLP